MQKGRANCEFQTPEKSMFSGIEHTAVTLYIGYTIESFLLHIETLPSACDDKFVEYDFQALILFMLF
jgi:hypothetical protein